MAKRKDAIALFEVMPTAGRKAEPAAETDAQAGQPDADAKVPQQEQAQPVPVVAPVRQQADAPKKASAGAKPAMRWLTSGEPIYRADGAGFAIRLSQAGWVLAGAVLVILLAGAFAVGRLSVRSAQQDGLTENTDATELAPVAGVGAVPLKPQQAVGKAGNWYLVIQDMQGKEPKHKQEADALVDFLKSVGQPAMVAQFKGGSMHYFVRSEKGFASQSDPEAIKYAKEIEALPKKYTIPGGYNFAQNGKPWFIPG
jgi:hypothetical protein